MSAEGLGSAASGAPDGAIDLAALRSRAVSREIAHLMSDGTEAVWCAEQDGEYVGWTTRDNAEAKGYEVIRTKEGTALLALIEIAEAAQALNTAYRAASVSDEEGLLSAVDYPALRELWNATDAASARLEEALQKLSPPLLEEARQRSMVGEPCEARKRAPDGIQEAS